jgi:two-component system, cell cycle sensor histidine kinase and response regulator CckA
MSSFDSNGRAEADNLSLQPGEGELAAELEALLANAPIGFAFLDTQLRYRRINRVLADMNGKPAHEHVGRTIREMFSQLADIAEPQLRQVLQSGRPIRTTLRSFEHMGPAREPNWWIADYFPVRAADGSIVGVAAVTTDVTDRMHVEQQLRSSQTFVSSLLQAVPCGISVNDEQGKYVQVNDYYCGLYGYSREELIGQPYGIVVPPEHVQTARESLNTLLQAGRYETPGPRPRLRKDGSIVYVEASYAPLLREDGSKWILGSVRDVTEQLQAREDRNRLEKLESLGVLAGGIAHDFNNLLLAILGNVSLAKRAAVSDREIEVLTQAELACARATDLTRQLLTFAKGGVPITHVISPNELVEETTTFCLRGSNVDAHFDLRSSRAINADPGQIGQVIQNLVINAKQAMSGGGTVAVSTNDVIADGKMHVCISVADTGHGIAEEHRSRIFDPYFTTKQRGSGLGLAIAHSIVKQHRGHIDLQSCEGKGSVFSVFLPAVDRIASGQPPREPIDEVARGRILIMDDEELSEQTLRRMLQAWGHEVVGCCDGKQAITLYQQAISEGRRFDAVFLDLTVPGGVGGKQAVEAILRSDPSAKVVVSSGYAADAVMADYLEHGFVAALIKPYDMEALGRVLVEALRRES